MPEFVSQINAELDDTARDHRHRAASLVQVELADVQHSLEPRHDPVETGKLTLSDLSHGSSSFAKGKINLSLR